MHEELRRRAKQEGRSVRDYVLDLIRRDQATPSTIDWLKKVDQLKPVQTGMSSADIVAAGRAEREGQLRDVLGD